MERDVAVARENSREVAAATSEAAVRCVTRLHGVSSVASLIGVRAAWKRLDSTNEIHGSLRLLSEFDLRQQLANSAARNASLRRADRTPQ